MAELPAVSAGDPHVAAHNDERTAINELSERVLPDGWGPDEDAPSTLVADSTLEVEGGTYTVGVQVGPAGFGGGFAFANEAMTMEQTCYLSAHQIDGSVSTTTAETASTERMAVSSEKVELSNYVVNRATDQVTSQRSFTAGVMGIEIAFKDVESDIDQQLSLKFPSTEGDETIATREWVAANSSGGGTPTPPGSGLASGWSSTTEGVFSFVGKNQQNKDSVVSISSSGLSVSVEDDQGYPTNSVSILPGSITTMAKQKDVEEVGDKQGQTVSVGSREIFLQDHLESANGDTLSNFMVRLNADRIETDWDYGSIKKKAYIRFPDTGAGYHTFATREWVASQGLGPTPQVPVTLLADKSSPVNTLNKFSGKMLLAHTNPGNPDNKVVPHWATDSYDDAPWVTADGTPVNPA